MFKVFSSFRNDLLNDAIQFEEWDFLKAYFQPETTQWALAMVDADQRKSKCKRITSTKIFNLAKKYPAFNEAALPTNKLPSVLRTR